MQTGTYTLITAPGGGLGTGNLRSARRLASFNGHNYDLDLLSSTPTQEILNVTPGALGTVYWTGAQGTAVGARSLVRQHSNWSHDAAGAIDARSFPTRSRTSSSPPPRHATTPVNTTLDQHFSIKGLVFNSSASGSVGIYSDSVTPSTAATR